MVKLSKIIYESHVFQPPFFFVQFAKLSKSYLLGYPHFNAPRLKISNF